MCISAHLLQYGPKVFLYVPKFPLAEEKNTSERGNCVGGLMDL